MKTQTQKIPVQFDLEIDAPEGERWEFASAVPLNPNIPYSQDTDLRKTVYIILRRVEPIETECEWIRQSSASGMQCLLAEGTDLRVFSTTLVEHDEGFKLKPGHYRDLASILESLNYRGELPQTKKREG